MILTQNLDTRLLFRYEPNDMAGERLSTQYDTTAPRLGLGPWPRALRKMLQKWKIRFTRTPKSVTSAVLAKPVTTEMLVRNLERNLELNKEAVRGSPFFYLSSIRHANTRLGSYHGSYLRSLQVHSGYK